MKPTTICLMTCLIVAAAASAPAQERPSAPSIETPLKLQVVMTRYDGEKKVSSMPYTVLVNAAEPNGKPMPKQMVMGFQVPLQTTVRDVPTIAFKDVGSKIGCTATNVGGGRYRLSLEIEQSSLVEGAQRRPAEGALAGPVLRVFRDSVDIVLHDGQTTQSSSATDPVTGEVLKIDVTLTVVK